MTMPALRAEHGVPAQRGAVGAATVLLPPGLEA